MELFFVSLSNNDNDDIENCCVFWGAIPELNWVDDYNIMTIKIIKIKFIELIKKEKERIEKEITNGSSDWVKEWSEISVWVELSVSRGIKLESLSPNIFRLNIRKESKSIWWEFIRR